MTAFIILAAGRGSRMGRVGESLHKALTPLNGRALISHIIQLAPESARIIVATGYRSEQVEDYVTLAHPTRSITFRHVDGWDRPGGGPGHSLLACRDLVDPWETLIYAACDTLWQRDETLWKETSSWAAVAPIPAGTRLDRWCRLLSTPGTPGQVTMMHDKNGFPPQGDAFVGLAQVVAEDQGRFWMGLAASRPASEVSGELRDVAGLSPIISRGRLNSRRVQWTDVGDEAAYHDAVARFTGYDWVKTGEATYVLPEEGRVVKYNALNDVVRKRARRAAHLQRVVPQPVLLRGSFVAYPYVPGSTVYRQLDLRPVTLVKLLRWFEQEFWSTRVAATDEHRATALRFYRDKTERRIDTLRPPLRVQARDAVGRIDWDRLAHGVIPGNWHGDLNFGNVLVNLNDEFVAIDWRHDFAGETEWGDLRYDLAKLLVGTRVNWEAAQHGDFRPWAEGERHERVIRRALRSRGMGISIDIIGALTLLNSAPLHASPLDEVLVARGVAWLEEALTQ